jgi:hypothetical protein
MRVLSLMLNPLQLLFRFCGQRRSCEGDLLADWRSSGGPYGVDKGGQAVTEAQTGATGRRHG